MKDKSKLIIDDSKQEAKQIQELSAPTKANFVRLLKHYVKEIETREIEEDSLKVSIDLEEIEMTQDNDAVRRFVIGKGRKLTIEWREA